MVDDAVPDGEQPVVEVHAAAGVVRDDVEAVADRRTFGRRADVDVAVLLVERVQVEVWPADDGRRDPRQGDRLR